MSRRSFSHGFLAGALLGLVPLLALLLALVTARAVGAQGGPASGDGPRLALVIGNSQYRNLSSLDTSVNDAGAVAKALEALGFQVSTETEAPLQAMRDAMGRFLEQLGAAHNRAALAVFYFAGHGLQYDGHNFMLPVDFDLDAGQDDLDKRSLWLDGQIARAMAGTRDAGANVILLEACRDDPFGDDPGLAQIDIETNLPERTLIVFAASPGKPSADKVDRKAPERNSIFTKELVDQLGKAGPSADLEGFFEVVRNQVDRATNRAQKPRVMARLGFEPVMLTKAGHGGAAPEDLKLWQRVEASPDLCDFDHYLASHPTGQFADRARAKIRAIKDKHDAMAKVLRDLPASVAAKLKAAQAESEARCAEKYGAKSATLFRAPAVRYAVSSLPSSRWDRGRFLLPARLSHGAADAARLDHDEVRPVQARPPGAASDAPVGDEEFRATLLKAEQGNVDAMYRVALIYEEGSNSVPRDMDEMLRWLSVSSALGNGLASYKLYRYYNAERRTLADAIRYKSLAKKQGYSGPPGLSVRR